MNERPAPDPHRPRPRGGDRRRLAALHLYAVFFHPLERLAGWSPRRCWSRSSCWLNVGLFIVAHDCMHGSLAPRPAGVNRWVGRIALALYAGFSFDRLQAEAFLHHHRSPGTGDDPDFSASHPRHFWRWYLAFLRAIFRTARAGGADRAERDPIFGCRQRPARSCCCSGRCRRSCRRCSCSCSAPSCRTGSTDDAVRRPATAPAATAMAGCCRCSPASTSAIITSIISRRTALVAAAGRARPQAQRSAASMRSAAPGARRLPARSPAAPRPRAADRRDRSAARRIASAQPPRGSPGRAPATFATPACSDPRRDRRPARRRTASATIGSPQRSGSSTVLMPAWQTTRSACRSTASCGTQS